MFRNSYQRGLFTVFFSGGSNPLNIWDTHIKNGHMTRFIDQELKALVFEIGGTNVSTTYMTCPKGKRVLGIAMPFMIMIVKNLKKYFTFEVTILDDAGCKRRFRVANFQSTTQIKPFFTVMPIGLSAGWNQIQFNLADFTRRAYNKQFIVVLNVKINANICIRRIYFSEKLYSDEELPSEYRLYFPLSLKGKVKRTSKTDTGNVAAVTSQNILEGRRESSENKKGSQDNSKANLTEVKKQKSETRRISSVEKRGSKDTNQIQSLKSSQQRVTTDEDSTVKNKGSEFVVLKSHSIHSIAASRELKAAMAESEAPAEAAAEDSAEAAAEGGETPPAEEAAPAEAASDGEAPPAAEAAAEAPAEGETPAKAPTEEAPPLLPDDSTLAPKAVPKSVTLIH